MLTACLSSQMVNSFTESGNTARAGFRESVFGFVLNDCTYIYVQYNVFKLPSIQMDMEA